MQWLKEIAAGLLLALIGLMLFLVAVALLPPEDIGFQRHGIEHLGRE